MTNKYYLESSKHHLGLAPGTGSGATELVGTDEECTNTYYLNYVENCNWERRLPDYHETIRKNFP
ncbi:hypothetical protein [Virgibacillus salexigens]|uniref:hypothetical protein n=1 Tax=Virgibacillus massiliensis TaxID=1462526 RepID=UPI0011DD728D|nr:hypothetical protein [Virgibacillus massiliensis]